MHVMNAKKLARIITLTIFVAMITLASGCFLSDPGDEGSAGNSGQSFEIDDQFVIIWNGYNSGKVTYVVVRNWPNSSEPEDRLKDKRLVISGNEKPKVRLHDGSYKTVAETPYLYFYDGDNLTSFPISMQEDDFSKLKTEAMTSYNDLLRFFKNHETK